MHLNSIAPAIPSNHAVLDPLALTPSLLHFDLGSDLMLYYTEDHFKSYKTSTGLRFPISKVEKITAPIYIVYGGLDDERNIKCFSI